MGIWVSVSEKGAKGIHMAAEKRGVDEKILQGQHVHKECRKDFTNPTQIKKHVNLQKKSYYRG